MRFLQIIADSRKLALVQQATEEEEFISKFFPKLLDIRTKLKEYSSNTIERGVQPISSQEGRKGGEFDDEEDYFGKLDEDDLSMQFQNIIPDYDMFSSGNNEDFRDIASRQNESAFRFE